MIKSAFDKKIVNQFISFGFHFHSKGETTIGKSLKYKYYPSYFDDRHYTLVLFRMNDSIHSDHRLYLHNNLDGTYIDSVYQISSSTDYGKNYIKEQIKVIFDTELRIERIKEILEYDE